VNSIFIDNKMVTVYFRSDFGPFDYRVSRTGNKRLPPLFNLTIFKGSKNVALTRNFSEFILKNPTAKKFYNSLLDMNVADESFYSTLATINIMPNGSVVQDFSKNVTFGMGSRTFFCNYWHLTCNLN
jgi:hypothetical protein